MFQNKIAKTDRILLKTRWKFPFYPTDLNVSMDIFDFNQLCMKTFSQNPNEEHNTSSSISIKLEKPLRKFPHVLHTAAAPTTAIRLKRTQIAFFAPLSLTHSQLVVKKSCEQKRHTKRITNLNLNHMSLFSVPCVHMKLKKKPSTSECTFFSSSLFFTAAAVGFCAIADLRAQIIKKSIQKAPRIMSRNS